MKLDLTKEEIATLTFAVKQSYIRIIKSPNVNEEDGKVLVDLTKMHMKLVGLKNV